MTKMIVSRRSALKGALGVAGAATAVSACATNAQLAAGTLADFRHGVASGDPHADSVIIWTRLSPRSDEPVRLAARWQAARDEGFTDIVAEGAEATDATRDYTIKIEVQGLEPGSVYYYRFLAGEETSPVGRTKTLPTGNVDKLVIAACSCSNYPFGYFHAYRHMAERGDLDAIIHLGDYIYEYDPDGYGGEAGKRLGRVVEPPHETVSLEDYRTRYGQYRRDPDLQAAHAAAPWIPTWDDHEITNNPWTDGAQNHQPDTEGPWEVRKDVAMRVYFEWMPVRDPKPGQAREAFWRAFEFGDLATLLMFETRLSGRSKQLDARDAPLIETPFDFSDPDAPRAVMSENDLAALDRDVVRMIRTPFEVKDGQATPILDYARIEALDPEDLPEGVMYLPAKDKFLAEMLGDDERTMIPPAQEAFFVDRVAQSTAQGVTWQVLGSQIIYAQQNSPNLDAAWDDDTKAAIIEKTPWIKGWISRSITGLPSNLDAWDGYPVQRDRLSDAFADADANIVIVTGDTHTWWANEIHDTRDQRIGAEFGATAVTSPSFFDYFAGAEPSMAELIRAANRDIVYTDGSTRGYLVVTFTHEEARCDMIAVSDIEQTEFTAHTHKSWRITPNKGGQPSALEEVSEA